MGGTKAGRRSAASCCPSRVPHSVAFLNKSDPEEDDDRDWPVFAGTGRSGGGLGDRRRVRRRKFAAHRRGLAGGDRSKSPAIFGGPAASRSKDGANRRDGADGRSQARSFSQ